MAVAEADGFAFAFGFGFAAAVLSCHQSCNQSYPWILDNPEVIVMYGISIWMADAV